MEQDQITVRAPQVFLDSNLNFPNRDKTVTEVTVTRSRCIDPTLIDSFLRTMRHGSDDIIKQKINNATKEGSMLRSRSEKCDDFVKNELYPNWRERGRVISFCQNQALFMKHELDEQYASVGIESERPKIDPRIDPYAERDRITEKESRYSQWRSLNRWVDNNIEIESILRTTSDKILKQNCNQNEEYMKGLLKFLKENKR